MVQRAVKPRDSCADCMAWLQDAKELLYRLYRAGFVSLQDIPRTADHAPSRTLYTWRVDIDAAAQKLAADLYKAALNVCLRQDHEYKQQKDVRLHCSAQLGCFWVVDGYC